MRLTFQDLSDLALGAAFLGAGGGGDPYYGRLMVEQALRDGHIVDLIPPDDVPDDALIIPSAMMGSPTIMSEKLPAGDEGVIALQRLEAHLGRQAFATMSIAAGGTNGLVPLAIGARLGLPIVDADGMGRTFPELQMETFHIYGVSGTPMVITNEYGDSTLLTTHDNAMMEWLARGTTVRMGGAAFIAEYPMDGQTVKRVAVRNTLSLNVKIGRCIREARAQDRDPFAALQALLKTTSHRHSRIIFEGQVIDVLRQTTQGFAKGQAVIESADGRQHLDLIFQNEYLLARLDGKVRAIAPDLICVLDSRTAEPIATESLRYGQPVKIIGVSVPDILRTPEALAILGPVAFGLDEPFRPVETLS